MLKTRMLCPERACLRSCEEGGWLRSFYDEGERLRSCEEGGYLRSCEEGRCLCSSSLVKKVDVCALLLF
jgi:hypothetical protein